MRLQGKVALVTGAARGIGFAIAQRFHAEGAVVYALDLAFSPPTPGLSEMAGLHAIICDIRDRTRVDKAIDSVVRRHRRIDILINNAGVNPVPAPVEKTSEEHLDLIIETNLKSIFHVTTAVLPFFAKGGVIINLASILGLRGVPSCSAYSASKGGIIALSKAMAKDYAPKIRVNSISPGAIETAMFGDYLARTADPVGERERIRREIPMQRMGQPEDIAAAALFLASDEASWVTGQNLIVDGGDSI